MCLFILNSLVLVCGAAVMHEMFLYFYAPFLFLQSLSINFLILVFCISRCYMILKIETSSLQIRHVSAAFVTLLSNAYVWCHFGLVQFPSHK